VHNNSDALARKARASATRVALCYCWSDNLAVDQGCAGAACKHSNTSAPAAQQPAQPTLQSGVQGPSSSGAWCAAMMMRAAAPCMPPTPCIQLRRRSAHTAHAGHDEVTQHCRTLCRHIRLSGVRAWCEPTGAAGCMEGGREHSRPQTLAPSRHEHIQTTSVATRPSLTPCTSSVKAAVGHRRQRIIAASNTTDRVSQLQHTQQPMKSARQGPVWHGYRQPAAHTVGTCVCALGPTSPARRPHTRATRARD
jgi:hypothetical protein